MTTQAGMQTVLITGAAGKVASQLRPLLRGVWPRLRLSDRIEPAGLQADEEFVAAELGDTSQLDAAVAGVDGILHLGGRSGEDDWAVIERDNIAGCHNLFEAARRHGVQRVVFASSNHAIGFYPRHRRIGTDALARPDSFYGVSKLFGEGLGALYADKYGLRVMCIRIGNVDSQPVDLRRLSIWISPRDLAQLVRIGLDHPALHYAVVWGVSDNERGWWDNETAWRLGYRPQDRAEDYRDAALAAQARLPADPLGDRMQGGTFCAQHYAGDPERSGS